MFRPIPLACFAFLGAVVSLGFAACVTDNTTTGITPITGIVVRSDSLVAGHGCGTGDEQVLEYAVIVKWHDTGEVAGKGVYDCFADATFSNIIANPPTRPLVFDMIVYAFDAATWQNHRDLVCTAVSSNNQGSPLFPACAGAGDAGRPPDDLEAALAPIATWSTTCTAQQQSDIEVLAVCGSLSPTHP